MEGSNIVPNGFYFNRLYKFNCIDVKILCQGYTSASKGENRLPKLFGKRFLRIYYLSSDNSNSSSSSSS